jgi:hypothetical protein
MNHATRGYCFYIRMLYDFNEKIYNALKDIPEFQAMLAPPKNNKCKDCMACQNGEIK